MLLPLFRTRPGRLFLASSILLIGILGLQATFAVPAFVEIVRKIVSLGWVVSVVWLGLLALRHSSRRWMWRVRAKLILSYLFLGVVPVVLAGAFVLVVSIVLYTYIANYVFQEGFRDVRDELRHVAESVSLEVGDTPESTRRAVESELASHRGAWPNLHLAVVPIPGRGTGNVIAAGEWPGGAPPALPSWLLSARIFQGTLLATAAGQTAGRVTIRSVVSLAGGRGMVVADLPVDDAVIEQVRVKTGIVMGDVNLAPTEASPPSGTNDVPASATTVDTQQAFRQTKALIDVTDWTTGAKHRAAVSLDAPPSQLYLRIVEAQTEQPPARDPARAFSIMLAVFAGMLLIVQLVFLFMGTSLARSITAAIHELQLGTEAVQRGEFGRQIPVQTNDQLGDLTKSFNRMNAMIPNLLTVEREKQRLDDELRIARNIQQSLLPVAPPVVEGLDIAAICQPAREVGGDYYDFFDLGPRQLGVLIADVSGKGTSAALYMAELKGLMLALSQTERSPKRLLVTLNRLLSGHLDNKSFITMTYAVLDLERMLLTCARAGHTPLIVASARTHDIVMPSGIVLGLRLPDSERHFEELLEEHTRPLLPGDVITLYTDGITEAMNADDDLFGDAALARAITSRDQCGAAAVRDRILSDVRAFVGDAEPHDDLTLVVMTLAGASAETGAGETVGASA